MADGFQLNRTARFVWMPAVALAVGLAAAGPATQAQTQGREAQLTSEQREILNSLPPDQRDALIDQVLGSGASGATQRGDQLQFPLSILPRDPNAEELESEGPFAEPRFRANDTLLLLLRIREFEDADPQPPPAAPPATPGQAAAQGAVPATPSPRPPRRSFALRKRSRNSRSCATASRIGIPIVSTVSADLKCRSSGRSRSPA